MIKVNNLKHASTKSNSQDRERSKREDLEKCQNNWHEKNNERIEYFVANCRHKPDIGCEECSKYCSVWCGQKIF